MGSITRKGTDEKRGHHQAAGTNRLPRLVLPEVQAHRAAGRGPCARARQRGKRIAPLPKHWVRSQSLLREEGHITLA